MNKGLVARRYARALFDLAADDKTTDAVARDLEALGEALAAMPPEDVAPGALDAELRDRVATAIAARVGDDALIAKFVRLLAARDRLAELPAIQDWFQRIRDDAEGRVRIDVATAAVLTPSELEKLVETFSKVAGRRVVPSARVDATLLGGAVVEIEGRVFDGSVRTALRRLSERMASGTGAASSQQ